METIGQIVGLCVVAFVIYWAGFFTAASMKVAAKADEDAEAERDPIYEHWRGER